jgi:hypothetical protein
MKKNIFTKIAAIAATEVAVAITLEAPKAEAV